MIIEDEFLTEIIPSPANRNYNEVMDDEDIVRWFEKKPWGWVVKEQNGCEQCGSPWCVYEKNITKVHKAIDKFKGEKNMTNNAKRWHTYRLIFFATNINTHGRICLGYCVERAVRSASPSGDYVGFIENQIK